MIYEKIIYLWRRPQPPIPTGIHETLRYLKQLDNWVWFIYTSSIPPNYLLSLLFKDWLPTDLNYVTFNYSTELDNNHVYWVCIFACCEYFSVSFCVHVQTARKLWTVSVLNSYAAYFTKLWQKFKSQHVLNLFLELKYLSIKTFLCFL